jgi:hypothetical protein
MNQIRLHPVFLEASYSGIGCFLFLTMHSNLYE